MASKEILEGTPELTPIILAARGDQALVNNLLQRVVHPDATDHQGNTALHIAISNNDAALVQLLLRSGANPNIQNNIGEAPLHLAVQHNFMDAIFSLLQMDNTNINLVTDNGQTPIDIAIAMGNQELISLLLEIVNDNSGNRLLPAQPPIIMLADTLDLEGISEHLKNNPTDINIQDSNGDTALHIVLQHGDLAISHMLLSIGANPNIQNNLGETPLHIAVANEITEVIESMILNTDIILDLVNNNNQTALNLANQINNDQLINMLNFAELPGFVGALEGNNLINCG